MHRALLRMYQALYILFSTSSCPLMSVSLRPAIF